MRGVYYGNQRKINLNTIPPTSYFYVNQATAIMPLFHHCHNSLLMEFFSRGWISSEDKVLDDDRAREILKEDITIIKALPLKNQSILRNLLTKNSDIEAMINKLFPDGPQNISNNRFFKSHTDSR